MAKKTVKKAAKKAVKKVEKKAISKKAIEAKNSFIPSMGTIKSIPINENTLSTSEIVRDPKTPKRNKTIFTSNEDKLANVRILQNDVLFKLHCKILANDQDNKLRMKNHSKDFRRDVVEKTKKRK